MPRRGSDDETRVTFHVPGREPVEITAAIGAIGGAVDTEILSRYVERLANLTRERKQLGDDIKELLEEAKAKRLNPKALKEIVRRQLETADEAAARQAVEEALDLYTVKLGLFDATPLGRAAAERNGNGAAHS